MSIKNKLYIIEKNGTNTNNGTNSEIKRFPISKLLLLVKLNANDLKMTFFTI